MNGHRELGVGHPVFSPLSSRPWQLPPLSASQTKTAHNCILHPLCVRDKYVFLCVIFNSRVSSQRKHSVSSRVFLMTCPMLPSCPHQTVQNCSGSPLLEEGS